jgi:hypothetical protein
MYCFWVLRVQFHGQFAVMWNDCFHSLDLFAVPKSEIFISRIFTVESCVVPGASSVAIRGTLPLPRHLPVAVRLSPAGPQPRSVAFPARCWYVSHP